MEVILAAAVTGIFAIVAGICQGRKTRRGTESLRGDIATNHGMRPGEYLEKISKEVGDIRDLMDLQTSHQRELAQQLADHTVGDAVSFETLRTLITERNPTRGRKS